MYSDPMEKVQDEIQKRFGDVDKNYLRKMQAEMHRCAARCCEDNEASQEMVHRCVENCSIKLRSAQKLIESGLNNFRDRLQRCYMSCNDTITDRMSTTPSETEIERYRGELDICAKKCVETHIGLISGIVKRTKEALGKLELENGY